MNRQKTINVIAYGILAFAGAGGFMLPSHDVITHASAEPAAVDVIYLTGPVRDFQKAHPDFAVVPSAGYGHYAWNAGLALANDRSPVFTGYGAKVEGQWHDGASEPIPPHLYLSAGELGGPLAIPVATEGQQPSLGLFDTWDSSKGPYGAGNIGPRPHYYITDSTPTVDIPAGLKALPNQGKVTYKNATTISTDMRFDELKISDTLTIDGDVTILCEKDFLLSTWSSLELEDDSSLTLYVLEGGKDWNHVEVNVGTADPSLVTIYILGTEEFMVHNHASIYARFIAPNAPLNITNHGAVFGTYAGETLLFSNHGDYHHDTTGGVVPEVCGVILADTPGKWGSSSTGAISSAESFSQWYRDVAGINLSLPHTIGLVRQPDGVYEFTDGAFYPIDDQLFGNEGESHNHYFTYTVYARFVYNACTKQFVELAGADDIWLYVDGRLGIDLGGILAGQPQHLSMDRMNLTDGETYTMRLFFAQRQGSRSALSIRTNIPLSSTELGSVSAGFD